MQSTFPDKKAAGLASPALFGRYTAAATKPKNRPEIPPLKPTAPPPSAQPSPASQTSAPQNTPPHRSHASASGPSSNSFVAYPNPSIFHRTRSKSGSILCTERQLGFPNPSAFTGPYRLAVGESSYPLWHEKPGFQPTSQPRKWNRCRWADAASGEGCSNRNISA